MKKHVLVAAMVLMLVLGMGSLSFAYDVTVYNETEFVVKVAVWTNHLTTNQKVSTQTIQPGGSYTWSTGAWCPDGLTGQIKDSTGNWRGLQETNCHGNKQSSGFWPACCWSLTFKVCRKIGIGYTEIRDDDYGFCKE